MIIENKHQKRDRNQPYTGVIKTETNKASKQQQLLETAAVHTFIGNS